MRVLGLIGLLLALLSVGWMAREQLGALGLMTTPPAETGQATAPGQQVQQIKRQLDQLMQTPRPLPEDAR